MDTGPRQKAEKKVDPPRNVLGELDRHLTSSAKNGKRKGKNQGKKKTASASGVGSETRLKRERKPRKEIG